MLEIYNIYLGFNMMVYLARARAKMHRNNLFVLNVYMPV